MASRSTRSRRQPKLFTARQTLLIVLLGIFCAFVVLMAISSACEKPFLPTWDELFDSLSPSSTVSSEWQMHVIDVGNADSILFTDHTHSLLIDAGERGDGKIVRDYLQKEGITRLDYVVTTHFHADHIGGMADVIRNVEIGTFLLSYMPEEHTPTTRVYSDMLEALIERNVPVREVTPRDTFSLGEATLDILGPVGESDDLNNQSVICRVTCGKVRFLTMGDAETPVENRLLVGNRADLRADVLKLGHHGSNTSSSREFVEAVAPDYAVITCGAGNDYGHPHKETLTLLDKLALPYYRSDTHGNIVFSTDGETLAVKTER